MIKYVEFESYDEYGQHIIPINTLGEMTKTAMQYSTDLMKVIGSMYRDPNLYYVVINALGSYEVWGGNRNGDMFPEAGLSHISLRTDMGTSNDYGFKTFEYYAKLFKHHCFPGTTLVNTKAGFVPISDVSVGDAVYSHSGKMRKVVDKFINNYSGDIVNLTIQGFESYDFTSTPSHPYHVVRRKSLTCPIHKKSGKNFCTFVKHNHDKCRICGRDRVAITAEWVNAEDIMVGDYVCSTPIASPTEPLIDHAVAWGTIYGFFLSEGSITWHNGKPSGLAFTFNKLETEHIAKLRSACSSVGISISKPYIHKVNNTAMVCCASKSLAKEFIEKFGRYSIERRISRSVIESIGFIGCKSLIESYIDGDGCIEPGKKQIRIRSSSDTLRLDIHTLLMSMGVLSSNCKDSKNIRQCGQYESKPSGFVRIGTQYGQVFNESIKVSKSSFIPNDKKSTGIFEYDGRVYTQVRGVSSSKYSGLVYNLEVESDNSYQVFGINVHNCNKDPNNSYGDVVFSHWNAPMHRVELIVGINRIRGKDIIDTLESGKQVAVSMGVKVKYDKCSICGNKATKKENYCKHLKKYICQTIDAETARQWSTELGKTILPGTQVLMINELPRFFDISRVFVGADRNAFILGKVAAHGNTFYSADIGEASGVQDEDIEKLSRFGKIAVVKKLGEIDKEIDNDIDGRLGKVDKSQIVRKALDEKVNDSIVAEPRISNNILDSAATALPLSHIFSTMLGLGIHPKPAEFQRIVLIRIGQKPLADDLESQDMVFNPDSNAPAANMDIDNRNYSDELAKALVNYLKSRSCHPDFLAPRLMEKQALYSSTTGSDYWLRPTAEQVVAKTQALPGDLAIALAGLASLFIGLKAKSMGYGAGQIAEIFSSKPWLGALLGGGVVSRIYSTMNQMNDPMMRSASSYENVLQNTNFSGHIKQSMLLPAAYFNNAAKQKSIVKVAKDRFGGIIKTASNGAINRMTGSDLIRLQNLLHNVK